MIETLVSFLIVLLILALVFVIFQRIIGLFPNLPAPIPAVAEIVILLIFLLVIVGYFGYGPHPAWR